MEHRSAERMLLRGLVPAPVKKSSFVAPSGSLKKYNIEVDLSAIAPYATGPFRDPKTLLWADQQTPICWHMSAGRLGSGRTGFFQGKYLKGIGRTQLAANWNLIADRRHGNGLLSMGPAIREYFLSRYLRSQYGTGCIVPCEGLLLSPNLGWTRKSYRWIMQGSGFTPADNVMHAISVKGGKFARFSNLIWMLNNTVSLLELPRFLQDLFAYLSPGRSFSQREVTPEELGLTLAALPESLLQLARTFFNAGISRV